MFTFEIYRYITKYTRIIKVYDERIDNYIRIY